MCPRAHVPIHSIPRITPTAVAPEIVTNFTLQAATPLYSPRSFIALAHPGGCEQVETKDMIALDESDTLSMAVPGPGKWVICYSTDGVEGPFVQQGALVHGLTSANASIITHLVCVKYAVQGGMMDAYVLACVHMQTCRTACQQ